MCFQHSTLFHHRIISDCDLGGDCDCSPEFFSSQIEVNDVSVDLVGAVVDAANVDDCGGRAPCEKNPCQNHGICRERGPKADDFECFCKAGYSGEQSAYMPFLFAEM